MDNETNLSNDTETQLDDLVIDDLENKDAPFEWICVTSCSCKCTSSSCAAWSF